MGNKFIFTFFVVLFLFSSNLIKSQVDTIFWFAAPDVDEGYGDSPLYLRISSLDQACTVYVTLPANPSISYTIDLAANSTNSINLTSVKDSLESKANTIGNNGIKIESTGKVSAYYDVVGSSGTGRIQNTEIFVLKGRYAMGKKFYTPIQRTLTNASNNNGYSGFDIVATEDNTTVTITPTAALYGGYAAGVPFNVMLNTGQTYSARALTMLPVGHPGGSLITSTKPVAVTVKDDALQWSIGSCRDLTGDQIVPVDFIGNEYIVVKGFLDGYDQAVIFGTEANTQIYVKGALNSTITAGSILPINITDNATYINSSKPVYLMHVSGFGCQLGAPILPSIECSGYDQISFTRSINYPFFLNIMTKAGTQDGFTLNGNAGLINASSFTAVPNKPEWVYAQLQFTESQIAVNAGNIIKNSKGNFQMGLLNGSTSSGSSCYGYFSGFNQFNPSIIAKDTCMKAYTALSLTDENMNSISWNFGDPNTGTSNISTLNRPYHVFSAAGTYTITADIKYACGAITVKRTLTIPPDIILNLPDSVKTCGEKVLLDPAPINCSNCKFLWSNKATDPSIQVSQTGPYSVKATSSAGCSKFDYTTVYNPMSTWNPKKNIEYCKNGTIELDALLPICTWSTGETTQKISVGIAGDYWVIVEKQGCKDTATIVVKERALPKFTLEDSLVFCSDKSVTVSVKNPYLPYYTYLWSTGAKNQSIIVPVSGNYSVEVKDEIDCKTIDTVKVVIYKLPKVLLNQDVIVCAEDSVKLYDLSGAGTVSWSTGQIADTIFVRKTGAYIAKVTDLHCSNTDTIVVNNWPKPAVGFNFEEYFCKGDIHVLDAGSHTSYLWSTNETTSKINITKPGNYFVDIVDKYKCKTRDNINVYEWEIPKIVQIDSLPESYMMITADNGTPPYLYSLNSIDFQEDKSFSEVEPGAYILTVKDANGCVVSRNISVTDDMIIIPQYFSPNGDGIKDTWDIIGLESYPETNIKIFDRFGKLIAEYKGIETSWNGTYQNKPVPADDYWYIIDFNSRRKPFTGHVTIVR